MIATIIIFVLVLSLLVFVHELGHFVMAKRAGVRVDEFGFGFPPRIWGIKRGGTIYSINWIPLGGFVKIKGEEGEHRDEPDSFSAKSGMRRFSILVAGVVMNFLLAAVLLSVGFGVGMPQAVDDLPAGAIVRDASIGILSVIKNSPAERAGFVSGETIVTVDGRAFASVADFQEYIRSHAGTELVFTMRAGGSTTERRATPEILPSTGKPGIGVGLIETGVVSFPWYLAPVRGVEATYGITYGIVATIGDIFKNLFAGKSAGVELSGPVGIAVATGQVARMGFIYLLQFMAVLSVNLAVLNVLPLPALDGGRILFLIIEKIRRRPVSRKVETLVHQIGFTALILLVLVVTYRDIARFGATILGK